jgi:hypothetical protein
MIGGIIHMVHHLTNNYSIPSTFAGNSYAKPRHDLVFDFAKGNLKIAGSTMDLLMFVSPYVDIDGRIIIPLETARRALNMQLKTLTLAIHQALENDLLYKKNGHYYSRFHMNVGKSVSGLTYLKLLQEYSSPTLLNYSLNLKRLFYYFASFTKIGTKKKVTIENLYKNELHTNTFGISYFDTFKDLAKAMLTLIKDDQIQVQLIQDEQSNIGTLLTHDTPELEKTFYAFFGKAKEQNERTSVIKREKHKIKVQLSNRVIQNEVRVVASETEFRLYADTHGICWEDMNLSTKNFLFAYKSDLYNRFGEVGLSIYRKSIQSYLKEHADSVLYHDLIKNKTANYVMDFYILKEVKEIIIGAARHQNILKGLKMSSHLLCNGYLINSKDVPEYLQYFMTKGSDNHQVQLDDLFAEEKLDYTNFVDTCPIWKTFDEDVHTIYRARYSEFKDIMDPFEWRSYVRELANRGLLANKVAFEEEIQELKETVLFMSKFGYVRRRYNSGVDFVSSVEKVPFYNWLEQRD